MSFMGKVRVLMLKGEKGDQGEAGTSGDYSELTNKPTINGVTLTGDMTSSDLGLESGGAVDVLSDQVDTLQEYVSGMIYTKTFTKTDISVNAGATSSTSQDVSVTGYDLVGVIGFDFLPSADQVILKRLMPIHLNQTVEIGIKNYSSSTATATVQFMALYTKADDDA